MILIVEDGKQKGVLLCAEAGLLHDTPLQRPNRGHQDEEGQELEEVAVDSVADCALERLRLDVKRLVLHRYVDVRIHDTHGDRVHEHREHVPRQHKESDDEPLAHLSRALCFVHRA